MTPKIILTTGFLLTLISLAAIVPAPRVRAENPYVSNEKSPEDAVTLTFLSSNMPPFGTLQDGKPVGFAVEILHEIMKRLGRADAIEFDDWKVVYERTLTEPNTVLWPPSRTPEREELFKWVGPLIQEKIVLFARKDSGLVINSLDDAKKVAAIATVRGYASENLLKQKGFGNLVSNRDPIQGPDALKFGRVDLWISSDITMRQTSFNANVDPDLFEPVFVVKKIPAYLAFSKSVPDEVVDRWQTSLDEMKGDGSWERIVSEWIPGLLRSGDESGGKDEKSTGWEANMAALNVILAGILSIAIYQLKTRGHRWLSLLILFYGIHSLLRWGMFAGNHFIVVYLPVVAFPATYLMGSAIFLYTNRILFDAKNGRLWGHMIVPGISGLVHITLFFAFPDEWTVAQIKEQTGIHKVYTYATAFCMITYVMTLCWLSLYRIIKYKERFKDNFSSDMIKNTRWLFYFVLLNLGRFTLAALVVTYCFIKGLAIPFIGAESAITIVTLLFFIYYLITKPEILPVTLGPELPEALSVEEDVKEKPEEKYAKMGLPDERRKRYAKKLENYMLQEQAFLDENISVPRISEELNIPRHFLSMAINVEFKQNFYNYVNGHRIRYAEGLLKDPEKNEESILMIAYDSGFQSKSSFNNAFKSLNEMTPSEYRRNYSKSK